MVLFEIPFFNPDFAFSANLLIPAERLKVNSKSLGGFQERLAFLDFAPPARGLKYHLVFIGHESILLRH
ncbi:MAG TPA: hypothetical protein DCP92_20700 [Nitrospiraceae bacterium]|nr:hypothetical protein [Nitrospiraceae bacterium]